jgi:cystathionine beta-lyase/cystathionine gamma-synthase
MTVLRSANTFVPALSCLAAGSLGDLESLITHKVHFEEAGKAFRFMDVGSDDRSKPVIRVVVAGDTS